MSDVESADLPEEPPRQGAIRLVFEYEGDQVRLVSRSRIEKVLPQTDQSADALDFRGTWSEVRDAAGALLDRRVLVDRAAEREPTELVRVDLTVREEAGDDDR
jgi:hypothetical protein